MHCVAIPHDASMHVRGRIVTERTGTDEKRIRVGRALLVICISSIGQVFLAAPLSAICGLTVTHRLLPVLDRHVPLKTLTNDHTEPIGASCHPGDP